MNKNQIKINGFLFSLLDSNLPATKISKFTTDLDEETEDFLKALIIKIHSNTGIKKGNFSYTHKYFDLLNNCNNNFEQFSTKITTAIHFLMINNQVIPSGNGIFINATIDSTDYFYFFKLNYQKRFMHLLKDDSLLELILNQVVLPSSSQKCDEAFYINLFEKEVCIIDKKFTIDGEPIDYLSNYILGVILNKSEDEIIKIINEVTTNTIEKHYENTANKFIDYKNILAETAEATATINTEDINLNIFQDKPEVGQEYIEALSNNGIKDKEIPISKKLEKKLTKKQKILTNNGIEILIPIEYLAQKDLFEYKQEANGKITILIKEIEKIRNN
ncbi:37-kD nucleoid-associated bacterial protein [anaerobic digester metagenome]